MEHPRSTSGVSALERQQLSINGVASATFWHRVRFSLVAGEVRRAGASTLVDLGAGAGLLGAWCRRRLRDVEYRWSEVSTVLAAPLRDAFGAGSETSLGEQVPPGAVVALLDVLEHIEDDVAALRALRASMRADSVLVITVPALPRLFSSWDAALGHHRRYSRRVLRDAVTAADLRVVRCDYLFPELLPLALGRLAVDRWHRPAGPAAVPVADFPDLPTWVDRVAFVVSRCTAACRRVWPLGTSLVVVAVAVDEVVA